MSKFLHNAVANWKSSLAGILTVVVATGVYFSAVPTGDISQRVAVVITIATGLAKVYLGLLQKD